MATGNVYYFFQDMLGSSNVVANSSGVLQNESDFYPFGGEAAITQSLTNQHYRFEGKERDPESASVAEPQGLDNFGARFDSSAMGRFMSPDWASSAEPVPYAKLENPQSLNLYSFAQNNPESDPDINGHQRAIACDFSCESDMSDYLNSTAGDEIALASRLSVAMITGYSDDWLEGAFMLGTGMSFEGAAEGQAQQQSGTSSTEAQNEQHQYDLVVERTNKLLGGAKDSDGDVINAADHISSACGLVGGNCEFKIKNGDADSDFRSALNKSLGEADGDTGAHGGLSAPTHRVGFSTSLHHDNDALHVDHYNGAKFPLGTLLHAIVDVGVGHLPYYGSNHAFSYAGVQ